MINNQHEYLQRAAEAFYERVPAGLVLYYREAIELNRSRYRKVAKCATVAHLLHELMDMDAPFARVQINRMAQDDGAVECLLLVARYVFAREAFARRPWRRPSVGGDSDRTLNEACLMHLLGVTNGNRHRPTLKCAVNGAFESAGHH